MKKPRKPDDPLAAVDAWARQSMKRDGVNWGNVDWTKLNPKDIGVRFGPALTEEQFREYRSRTGQPVHIVKRPS